MKRDPRNEASRSEVERLRKQVRTLRAHVAFWRGTVEDVCEVAGITIDEMSKPGRDPFLATSNWGVPAKYRPARKGDPAP